ncbi:hypothetical protein [Streptomyces sp. T028]|uniref:hypothetical protein n=1 Tax=Streptomyces sp. T028 TaxID=3394379 RepID=UPI003A83774D
MPSTQPPAGTSLRRRVVGTTTLAVAAALVVSVVGLSAPAHTTSAGAAHNVKLDSHHISTVADAQILWNVADGADGFAP